jgi:DNA-binding MarR family transcriptional regulator
MRNISSRGSASPVVRLEQLLLGIARHYGARDPLVGDFETMGMTPSQLHALMWIGHDGPLTMGQLARRLCISEKTITGLVDRLERAALCQRERDEKDRRIIRARISRKGTKIFREFHQHLSVRLEHFFELLDEEEHEAVFRILEKVHAKLAKGAFESRASGKEPS